MGDIGGVGEVGDCLYRIEPGQEGSGHKLACRMVPSCRLLDVTALSDSCRKSLLNAGIFGVVMLVQGFYVDTSMARSCISLLMHPIFEMSG